MHLPGTFWANEMGDIEVIVHDGVIHIFYLCLPSHDTIAHIVSTDGLTWTAAPHALHTGDPGEFDDDQLWTMGVFRLGGTFFMLYTGLARAERGKVQRVGLAVSDDLYHWRKHPGNPVLEADPRWYVSTCSHLTRVDWRDPKVWVEDGIAHGVICARSNQPGAVTRSGCIGYFTSRDGYQWEQHAPLVPAGLHYEYETPALFRVDNRYILTAICGHDHGIPCQNVYLVADKLTGPYRRLADDHLLPAGNMVFKPCCWNDQTLLFHNLRGTGDWPDAQDLPLHTLAPPKIVELDQAGSLHLRPFRDWQAVSDGAWHPLPDVDLAASTFSHTCLADACRDFILELTLASADAVAFGIALRADSELGEGSFISLQPGRATVVLYSLQKRYKNPSVGVRYGGRPRVVVQQNHLPDLSGPCACRLVARGPYLEFSVNDTVLLSALSWPRPEGALACFAEEGTLTGRDARLTRLTAPSTLSYP